jgi:hypothetical protein
MTQSGRVAGAEAGALLDIGGDVGALVLHTPEALSGREVELAPDDDLARLVHTVVRERRIGGRRLFLAVFPSLPAGRYRVCLDGARAGGVVQVVGGLVAEADWPGKQEGH